MKKYLSNVSFLLFVFLFFCDIVHAQKIIDITVKKPGTAIKKSKVITKTNDIDIIRVHGTINDNDMNYFSSLRNKINILDLSGVTWTGVSNGPLKKCVLLMLWDDNLDMSILDQVTILNDGAFKGSKLENINVPLAAKSIPDTCFYNCTNLKTVNLGKVKRIGLFAFANTPLEQVIIPESVTEICDRAFDYSNIKKIILKSTNPPAFYHIDEWGKKNFEAKNVNLSFLKNCNIIIPKNSRQNYAIGLWKNLMLLEEGEQSTYDLTIEKAGTLASVLTDKIKNTATSLTIRGFLYDTDLKLLKECSHLRFLDLSHSYVSISPETVKDKEEERKFLNNLLFFVADAAEKDIQNRYKNGQANIMEKIGTQLESMTLKDLVIAQSSENIKVDAKCWMPGNIFNEMQYLKELRLPMQLGSINGINNSSVETIILPVALQRIEAGAFAGCKNLKSINIPKTVQFVGARAFYGCESLKFIDLSSTSIENIYEDTFKDADNIEEIRFPKTLKEMNRSALDGVDIIHIAPEIIKIIKDVERTNTSNLNKQQLKEYKDKIEIRNNIKEIYNIFKMSDKLPDLDFMSQLKLYFKTREIPKGLIVYKGIELHIPKGSRAGWQLNVRTKNIIED